MAAERPRKTCPECGREVAANNYVRHVRTHGIEVETNGQGRKRGTTLTAAQLKQFKNAHARSKAVGAYLALLDEQSDARRNGGRRQRGAYLGRLEGFPNWSDDPDVIDKAAAAIVDRAAEVPSYVAALKLQQRAIDLRATADDLRNGTSGEVEAAFIAVAAEWATDNGIGYAAFRAMGVPAAVLREAGVS